MKSIYIKSIGDSLVIMTMSEITLIIVLGICLFLLIVLMFFLVVRRDEKRKEYLKTLNDKEYRTYNDYYLKNN